MARRGIPVLADHMTGRDNNLNLLRLIAAGSVLLSHAFPITYGTGTPEPFHALTGNSLGGHAVAVFFILSGLLIASSFENSRTVLHWAMARFFRLFPGLLGVVLLTVLVLGPVVTTLPPSEYYGSSETWEYLVSNLRLFGMQFDLPGVFDANPYPRAVNGSLWSLRFEVACYGLVGIFGLAGALRKPALAAGFVALVLAVQIVPMLPLPGLSLDWVRSSPMIQLGGAFGLGSAAYVLRRRLPLDLRILAALAAGAVLAHGTAVFPAALLFAMVYAVLWSAYVPGGAIRRFNRLGDYSYGVYLYAFPVQQFIAWYWPGLPLWLNVVIAMLATAILAFASWHLLEKRAMAFGKRMAGSIFDRLPTGMANRLVG